MRIQAVLLAIVLAGGSSLAAKKGKPAPPPEAMATCDDYDGCINALSAAFEATDFERAQRLARIAETFAQSAPQRAKLLVLSGALDAQSLGLTDAPLKDAVASRFEQAITLDGTLTSMAIPSYARTEALEALWKTAQERARPPVVLTPKEVPVPPAVTPTVTAAPKARVPVVPVVLGGLAVAAGGVGLGFGLASQDTVVQRDHAPNDKLGAGLDGRARQQATIANVSFGVAGAAALGALVTWLLIN